MEEEHFSVETFVSMRRRALEALIADPRKFLEELYIDRARGFFGWNSEITSPYLPSNDPRLCCLLGEGKECPTVSRFTKTKAIEGGRKITSLDEDGRKISSFALKKRKIGRIGGTYREDDPRFSEVEVGDLCLAKTKGNIAADAFTNEWLVGYIIDEAYRNTTLDGVVRIYSAALCNDHGSIGAVIMELVPITLPRFLSGPNSSSEREYRSARDNFSQIPGDVSKHLAFQGEVLSRSMVVGILRQVVSNLHFLQETVAFVHGDLHLDNVLVSAKETNIEYAGIRHNARYSLKIGSLSRASAVIDGIRVYQNNPFVEKFFSLVRKSRPPRGKDGQEPYYVVDDYFVSQSLMRVRHMELSFYKSWDTATFVVSLMLFPLVFFSILTDKLLQIVLLGDIWFPEDAIKIFERVSAIVKYDKWDYATTVSVLKDIRIKCRMTEILLSILR